MKAKFPSMFDEQVNAMDGELLHVALTEDAKPLDNMHSTICLQREAKSRDRSRATIIKLSDIWKHKRGLFFTMSKDN